MSRAPKLLWILLALICSVGILQAGLPPTTIDAWTSAVNLSQPRANAASALLPDGRILITGGDGGSGALNSAEFFTSNGTISSAAVMNVARAQHFAVVLADGRVLVGGGVSAGGGTTNAAEIYDPTTDSWTQTSPMTSARANASAALLEDGRVLIAGGDNSGNPSNTIEIFDPSTGVFGFAGTLSTPRTKHAMAVLQDGRVLIVGGFDGNNALASCDIFDPSSGTVSAGPPLATPRYAHSATTLLNGQVVVIGGATTGSTNTVDVSTAEIFDPATGVFTNPGTSLGIAREGHQAFLLPSNNSVLVVGGMSAGQVVGASELLVPQVSTADGSWSYVFAQAASNVTPRAAAVGTAMNQNGLLLVAGGSDASGNTLASTELYAFPVVKTDASDYPPGSTVTISGSGFKPGEIVNVTLVESPLIDTHGPYAVTADGNGNFTDSSFSTDIHDVNVRFWLSAVGSQSGLVAQNTFTDAAGDTTAATVSCSPNPVPVNSATLCTATVSNVNTPPTNGSPQGTVTFSFNGTGTFSPASAQCTVAQTGTTTASCSVSLTPTVQSNGNVKGNFNSSDSNKWKNDVSPNFSLAVTAPTCTAASVSTQPTSQTITYGQNATFTAAGGGSPSPTIQWQVSTNGGTTWTNIGGATSTTLTLTTPPANSSGNQYRAVFSNTCNGTQTATSNAATLTVNKANATVVVTPYTVTYDGQPHTAAVTSITGVNGETGATVGTVDVSHTTHTNAGTYSTDSWSFTGAANYNNIAATTITDTINKANATVVVTPYTVTYDGQAHTAAVTSITGVNGETGATVGTVDVSHTTHTNAGTYSSDSWSFAGTANYNNIAATTITDTIDKANATVVVTPYTVTYDGQAHTAAVTSITGVNGETGATVGTADVSHTTHTNAGTYSSDYWTFTGTANYNNIAATTITDTINKANATVVVTPYTVTYDGSSHTAAVTSITGVNGETGATVGTVDVSNTTHTNAGTYSSDYWTFTGTANYNNIAATTITDTINKANATVVVTPYTVTYDGSSHTAAVTSITGVNGETGVTVGTVDVSNTTHTAAGTYSSDSWTFTGAANYNNIAATTITDTINKANATVVVTPYSVTYDGQAHTAAVTSITGVNGETGVTVGTVDVSNTTHTAAGTYSSDSWTFTGTANYNNIGSTTITDTINKANATIVVTPYTVTYDGSSHTATVASITGVNGEAGATVGTVDVSHTSHINAGTYSTDYWTFSGTANYNDIGATTITDTINKAAAIVTVTPYSVTYDGNAHTATGSATGVKGEALTGLDLSHTTHTSAGTYASDYWTFTDTTGNYNDIANTGITDTINKANAVVVITPYTVTYDGHPHTAGVTSIAGVNGETGATVGTVDVSHTTHINAGTYSSDYWTFTGTANYNDIAATTITDTINKANAGVVLTPYTVTYDGQAHTATVASITGVNGETGATVGTVDVSNTTHTAAGTYSSDFWTFTGTANYNNIGNTMITDTINKANAVVVVTAYAVTYDGSVHTATVTSITGVNGETGATVGTVDVSHTTHTNPGDYPSDPWSFTGTANYNNATGAVHDSISFSTACAAGAGNVILPPINIDGSSVYQRKGGSTIPVKFRVCGANGVAISNASLVFGPSTGSITMLSAVRGTVNNINETTDNSIPDVAFRWDSSGQQWIFNMGTTNLVSGTTYSFRINLAYDPQSIVFVVGVK